MFVFLVSMHESYYVAFNYFIFYRLGTGELRVMWGGGEGSYELPPSHSWPYSVDNKLFLKPREAHSSLYDHHRKYHTDCSQVLPIREGFQTQINRWLTHPLYIWSDTVSLFHLNFIILSCMELPTLYPLSWSRSLYSSPMSFKTNIMPISPMSLVAKRRRCYMTFHI